MIKVNKKNKAVNKTFEFLTIFTVTFGLMIGAGLYMKNSSNAGGVLGEAHGYPILAIVMWIVIGATASMMMLVFVEGFSTFKAGDSTSITNLAKRFLGKKFASWLAVYYTIVYMPLLTSIGALYTISVLFDGIDGYMMLANSTHLVGTGSGQISLWTRQIIEIIAGISVLVGFTFLNGLTKKPGKIIQISIISVKFIPILIVILGGTILGATSDASNIWTGATEAKHQGSESFSIGLIFTTAVPVMFAFNGFADGAAIQKDVEHKQVIAPAMIFAMIACTIFYTLVAATIFWGTKDGSIFSMFDIVAGKVSAPWLTLILRIIAAFTVMSLLNAYTLSQGPTFKGAIDDDLLFIKGLKGKITEYQASWIQAGITIVLTIVYMGISLGVKHTAVTVDGATTGIDYFYVTNMLSDLISIAAFSIYLSIMIGIVVNRKTHKNEVKQYKGAFIIGIIASTILGIEIAYLWVNLYILSFVNLAKDTYTGDAKIKLWLLPLVFSILGLSTIVGYYINNYSGKKLGIIAPKAVKA